jgi:predicted nucleic acid-binding protein
MKIVLDASAAIAAVLGREPGPAIVELISRASLVMAPDIFVAEVSSGPWKYVNAGYFSVDEAIGRLRKAVTLVKWRESTLELAAEALREASARRHAVYDLYYVVLARREGAVIVTLDKRLRKLVESMALPVHP